MSESGITVGEVNEVSLTVQRLAQLSGIVFWDLDENDSPGFFEGLSNASLTISPNIPELELDTYEIFSGENGAWSVYLPAQTSWDIEVTKDGFENVESSIGLGLESMSEDIEIAAGEEEVSGIVSYPDNSCISNEDWDLVMIPSHGISRERVTATKASGPSGWTGEWSASVSSPENTARRLARPNRQTREGR